MANNTAAIREAFRAYDVCGDGYVKEGDIHNLLGDEFKSTIENWSDAKNTDYIDYARLANIVSQEIAEKENKEETPSATSPTVGETGTVDRQESSGPGQLPTILMESI